MSATPASLPLDAYDTGRAKAEGLSALHTSSSQSTPTTTTPTTFLNTAPASTLIPLFLDPQYSPTPQSSSKTTPSPQTQTLLAFVAIPFQAITIFIVSRALHQFVLCINELYEFTGRRARSKFASVPWLRIVVALVLMGCYHVGLVRLMGVSYRRLRRGGGDGEGECGMRGGRRKLS